MPTCRWKHVPFAAMMVLLVMLIDRRFNAGSRWLFHAAWMLRVGVLVLRRRFDASAFGASLTWNQAEVACSAIWSRMHSRSEDNGLSALQ